ncbi:hypothetical protein [Flavobacterium sp.]|uniref:hypothetical protein n=1 Tax=Flavobacterium sp. TaxID=239 RepID=UPI00286B4E0B|nr:hypothetical protein [Flavobacterium sp.]
MKNKVINLFNKLQIVVPNTGVKYSQLLEKFLEPFVNDFKDVEFYEDIFEFGINAWNSANMKLILPKEDNDNAFNALENSGINVALLNRMIEYKISHFKNYTNFIVDYDLEETIEDPILKITTQEQDAYLKSMFEQFNQEDLADDFDENYINRSAIIIMPRQPFIDWCSSLYPEDLDDVKETRTYLISEDIDDIDSWLAKKFDKLFTFELESWHTNKKEWPQKRNYKMFKEWFQIDISRMIYDFEINPILKF